MKSRKKIAPDDRITIREVATRAGVSVGTVSRFVNGFKLKKSTTAKVDEAIDELGYKQNVIARGMITHRTFSIGILLPIFDEFHTEILSAVQRLFDRQGYSVGVSQYESEERTMEEKIRFMRERYTDGLIISPNILRVSAGVSQELRRCRDAKIPLITFNNRLLDWEADHVHVNDGEAVQQAIDYLVHMKHTDIAILAGSENLSTARERLDGYHQAMQRNGIPKSRRIVLSGHWSVSASGYSLTKKLFALKKRPTAVFVANKTLALGLLEYMHEMDLRIPEDLAIVSFDDSPVFALHRPGITALRQPSELIAQAIAGVMIRRLSGDWSQFPFEQRIATELILRRSVASR
jgi:DNA-binding LacI/PurR family transcriptional regulator